MARPVRPRAVTRRGMALFEVIVALTILVVAGLSTAVWARQTLVTVDHTRATVAEVRVASDYLDRIALWPREDLDRHLGVRREGLWLVDVERPTPTIYAVVLGDSTGHVLLRTWLYRAEVRAALSSVGGSHGR